MKILSASIVLYKTNPNLVNRIIDCIRQSNIKLKLWVIDNSPEPCIVASDFPDIEYIHSIKNLGYGSAHNIALKKSIELEYKYHVVLNPDIVFTNSVLSELIDFMDKHSNAGLVMPCVKYPNGDLQYLCKLLPTPMDLVGRRFLSGIFPEFVKKQNYRYELRNLAYDGVTNIPSLSGCFMFLRINALKETGIFDQQFFMYAEDLDLSRRMHSRFQTLYVPSIQITHDHAKESYQSKKMLIIHMKSIIKYFNKWGWFFDKERRTINRITLMNLSEKIRQIS